MHLLTALKRMDWRQRAMVAWMALLAPVALYGALLLPYYILRILYFIATDV